MRFSDGLKIFQRTSSVYSAESSNITDICHGHVWTLDWKAFLMCCVYKGNFVNIRAHVLLIILWALHEYFIYLRAPAGVWIMQLVSLRGKRMVAEPPKLTDVLM